MNSTYEYVGCFVDQEELLEKLKDVGTGHLDRVIKYTHVTFEYKPETVDETLFGEELGIKIVGYGKNGENEGVRVELTTENPRLREMISEIEIPHITLSVSEKGKPVNTKYLSYSPIYPIKITGIYGGYVRKDDTVIKSA